MMSDCCSHGTLLHKIHPESQVGIRPQHELRESVDRSHAACTVGISAMFWLVSQSAKRRNKEREGRQNINSATTPHVSSGSESGHSTLLFCSIDSTKFHICSGVALTSYPSFERWFAFGLELYLRQTVGQHLIRSNFHESYSWSCAPPFQGERFQLDLSCL